MALIPGNPDKMNDLEVSFEAPLSETLFNKIGANINFLIDNLGLSSFQTFAASANFNVPEDVTRVFILAWAGGGGGAGNGTGSVDGGHGLPGGSTIWADPTNGTTNFYGGNGGGRPGTTSSVVPITQSLAIFGQGGSSNGGSFGGHGGDGAAQTSGNGSNYYNFVGGAGGAWGANNRPGGGGGAGPFGNGAVGGIGTGTVVGGTAAVNSGAGGGGSSSLNGHGAGGGAGSPLYTTMLTVTGLDIIPVTIGAGGAGGFPTAGAGAIAGGGGGSGWLQVWW